MTLAIYIYNVNSFVFIRLARAFYIYIYIYKTGPQINIYDIYFLTPIQDPSDEEMEEVTEDELEEGEIL